MSEANVEAARTYYAEPDPLTALADRIADDAEFDFTAIYPDRPVVRGVEAARSFRAQGPWGAIEFEPERFIDVDDERVLVLVRASGTGRSSGATTDRRVAHELTFRDGMLVRFKVYSDPEKALEALGLSG
jgi:ketosteroid isomerase-like protein